MLETKRTPPTIARAKATEAENRKPVKAIRMPIRLREKAGLTTNALADGANVDQKNLWNLEHGIKRNPGRDLLINLGRTLVSFSKAFTEEDVDRKLAAADYPPAPLPNPTPRTNHLIRGIR